MSRNAKYFAFTGVCLVTLIGIFLFTAKQAESDQLAPAVTVQQEPLQIPAPITPVIVSFQKEGITIVMQDGEVLPFTVELALTPQQQAQGLMFRTEMAEDAGMLFVFNTLAKLSFWMKNTLIPLDMLFLNADGTINHIHANAVPKDLTPVGSDFPSKAVLELNGGTAEKMGIQVGDQVMHELFSNTDAQR